MYKTNIYREESNETILFSRVVFLQSRNSHDSISNILHDTSDKVIIWMFFLLGSRMLLASNDGLWGLNTGRYTVNYLSKEKCQYE